MIKLHRALRIRPCSFTARPTLLKSPLMSASGTSGSSDSEAPIPGFPKSLDAGQIIRANPHLYPRDGNNSVSSYGLCVGDGWYPIVSRLSAKLESMIIKSPDPSVFYAVQVKEKFGGLRFYMSCQTGEMTQAIEEAEEEAEKTCEGCGKPGELCDSNGWLRTACEDEECRGGAVPVGNEEQEP